MPAFETGIWFFDWGFDSLWTIITVLFVYGFFGGNLIQSIDINLLIWGLAVLNVNLRKLDYCFYLFC